MILVTNSNTQYKEGDVAVDGFNIHYLEWGKSGPEIVLLHGSWPWGMAHNLDHLSLPLSAKHHVLTPDLPGFGKSDDPKEEMGFKTQVDLLHGAMQNVGFKDVTLVGISYGGFLTMTWPAIYPEDVSSAIILDIPPMRFDESFPPDPHAQYIPCPDRFTTKEKVLEYCAKVYHGFTEEYMLHQLTYGALDFDGMLKPPSPTSRRKLMRRDRDLWSDLAAIQVPTLLVYGAESHFFNPKIIEEMKKVNHLLSVLRIEGANHYLPTTHIEETLDAIKDFTLKTR